MSLREVRYSRLFLGVANVGLAIWALAEAKYAFGAFLLVLGVFWLSAGGFLWKLPRHLKSKGDT